MYYQHHAEREGESEHIFFFNDTATTEIYTLSLHDALPISRPLLANDASHAVFEQDLHAELAGDRKSTRLNSSHVKISYAVFCLKKKKKIKNRMSIETKQHLCQE